MIEDAPITLVVCVKTRLPGSPSCGGRGSPALLAALRADLSRHGLDVSIQEVQCLGRCTQGPNLRIKGGAFFTSVSSGGFDAVRRAIEDHRAGCPAPIDPSGIPPSARG